ncbi:MAG TPA: DUF4301 family protein [Bacteroidales bacterium]|nr:DUF4301 family protein [Bacteroidales bacterium]
MLTKEDLHLLRKKGITEEKINAQLEQFRHGFPYMRLDRPATPGDGIIRLESKRAQDLARFYDEHKGRYQLVKFVPASGAASRMFKHLHAFLSDHTDQSAMEDALQRDKGPQSVQAVLRNLSLFAFFDDLKEALKRDGKEVRQLLDKQDYRSLLEYLMDEKGLNYASLPKALLKFHRYDGYNRTAMEEHMVEGNYYVRQEDGSVPLHFTISPEHEEAFRKRLEKVTPLFEQRFSVKYDISFSNQKPSTDTIAVDMDNQPLRDADGQLVFRPGGHGALLENLNDLGADIVFIKNIDNVVPDRLKQETYLYKKVLGGYLIRLRRQVSDYLRILEQGMAGEELCQEIMGFATQELNIRFPDDFHFLSEKDKANLLFRALHRPIRVCGMVRNEGEPGGGPFWVRDHEGGVSLQIVESSQIDHSDPQQHELMGRATHFNPVDLACSTTDYKGEHFDLDEFTDPETGFISTKSVGGKQVKALELPGLWNGAMAKWITAFIEVPIITFNPVKTINDLLRKEHQ